VSGHTLEVQHVGSTAIPGVSAKPVLDVLVGVAGFDEAVCALRPLGYCYRGEHGIPRRHYFVKGDPRTHHLHMVEALAARGMPAFDRAFVAYVDQMLRDSQPKQ
jgi:GrpB-like predicted nucleotidyltransferase (UPF0157 family)